jgi:hypothetical protein
MTQHFIQFKVDDYWQLRVSAMQIHAKEKAAFGLRSHIRVKFRQKSCQKIVTLPGMQLTH